MWADGVDRTRPVATDAHVEYRRARYRSGVWSDQWTDRVAAPIAFTLGGGSAPYAA
jgi:hypothetical protein